jgi:hypothetical protein
MNVLSTLITTLAQAKAADKEPSTPLFGSDGYIGWLQLILLLVLVGLVGFFFYYRKKQQED